MDDSRAIMAILLATAFPLYVIAYLVLNARWDRSRIAAEIEGGGGTVLDIRRAPNGTWVGGAREYQVSYEEADGTRRDRHAVTTFWMGVAWRDPPARA